MSWHTTAILIKDDDSGTDEALFKKLGIKGAAPEGIASFEDATSSLNEGVAVGEAKGWKVLLGSLLLFLVEDDVLAKLGKRSEVFHMVVEGASNTAGFSWWSGGKLQRSWLRQEDQIINDEGKPLPVEAIAFANSDDEQGVLGVWMATTLSFEELESVRFRMYSIPEDTMFD